jgi:lysozyme
MYGIDMASHEHDVVDWHRVRGSGRTFAFVRASHGQKVDPAFASAWPALREAGILRGAYHLLRHDQPAEAQAVAFLEVAKLERGDMPPMLDIEGVEHLAAQPILAAARRWLALVEDELHALHGVQLRPFISTSARVWKLLGNPPGFEMYPLWVVDWLYFDAPRMPTPWGDSQWLVHQYAGETVGLPGVSTHADLDRFRPLKRGDRGPCITRLKVQLAIAGFGTSPSSEFDDATRFAVIAFQSARGLLQDGIVGPKTFAALHWG